ncbi:MAG: hypothetical protein U0941_14870 [Planctomycetaceae bacterium]
MPEKTELASFQIRKIPSNNSSATKVCMGCLRMTDATLLISIDSNIDDSFLRQFVDDCSHGEIPLEVEKRTCGPTMGIEWLLPTTVIVLLTKPFMDELLQRAARDFGDAVYPPLKSAVSRLAAKIMVGTVGVWQRFTASGPISRVGKTPFFSIELQTRREIRAKFVFEEGRSQIEYEQSVVEAITIACRSHTPDSDDPLADAPLDPTTRKIYLAYDPVAKTWNPINVMEEIRRERARNQPLSDL